jgi:hypothetical protein
VVKAIGYDVTEEDRLGGKGTYRPEQGDRELYEQERRKGEKKESDYVYWYPLMEWGWDRARCWAEIKAEIGVVPPKSSCLMCAAMQPEEVAKLPRDLLLRALTMEQCALRGRHARGDMAKVKGIGAKWSWTAFALAREGELEKRQREVSQEAGQLVDEREVAEIIGLVDEWIMAAPDQGKGDSKKAPFKYKGRVDMRHHEIAREFPAFTDLLGFRNTGFMAWRRWQKKCRTTNPGMPYDPLLDGG